VVAALAAAGLPVAGVTPRHARAVAKATGPWAKTDALDARAIAPVAEAVRPMPRPLPDTQADELRAWLARRRPWVTMRTAKQHRLGRAPPRLLPDIQAHLTGLNTRLTTLDDDLDTTRRARPVGQERAELLRRGRRTTWGGRAHVRATLSMSPRVAVRYHPVFNAFDARLRAAGKAAKVALTACMRTRLTILNARVTHHAPWPPEEVRSA
jgi:transposase